MYAVGWNEIQESPGNRISIMQEHVHIFVCILRRGRGERLIGEWETPLKIVEVYKCVTNCNFQKPVIV